jgi:hypothetical protein
MMETHSNPTVHHERTDVEAGGVLLFAVGLIVALALLAAGVWGLFHFLGRTEPAPALPVAAEDVSSWPPSPRLEGIDLERSEHHVGRRGDPAQQQAAAEEAHLQRYGWVDRKTGRVHIPIEEAIKKVAGRLPAQPRQAVDEFEQAPTRSSSGRMARGGTP